MALATRLQKPSSEEDAPIDITVNLDSLQFGSALTEDEKKFQILRKRLHALTVTSCAQASFLVSTLNEARQLKKRLKSPPRRANRLLLDEQPGDPLKVGIIGCGRLGSQLAHCFITYGGIQPKDLKISTRRPETLEYLLNRGVDCFYDNIKLVTKSHIVFLCVLPAQVPGVAEEVKNEVSPTLFIYSLISSYPVRKLGHLFRSSNVIRPEYTWDDAVTDHPWDHTVNVNTALENTQTVAATSPLVDRTENVIKTSKKLTEQFIFVFVNMCTHLKLDKHDTLDMLHSILFESTEEGYLEVNDFIRGATGKDISFPPFDLIKVQESNTAVLKKLRTAKGLSDGFHTKYTQVFQDYIKNKAISAMYES